MHRAVEMSTICLHTILPTETPVEVCFVDLGDRTFSGPMKQPALIQNSFGVVSIKVFLLGSILPIESWVLDTLNFGNGFVILHCFVKLCKYKFVLRTCCCKINHK